MLASWRTLARQPASGLALMFGAQRLVAKAPCSNIHVGVGFQFELGSACKLVHADKVLLL